MDNRTGKRPLAGGIAAPQRDQSSCCSSDRPCYALRMIDSNWRELMICMVSRLFTKSMCWRQLERMVTMSWGVNKIPCGRPTAHRRTAQLPHKSKSRLSPLSRNDMFSNLYENPYSSYNPYSTAATADAASHNPTGEASADAQTPAAVILTGRVFMRSHPRQSLQCR